LQQIFEEFDSNDVGSLDLTQFQKLCKQLNPNTSDEEVHDIFEAMDFNRTGCVE